MFRNIFLCNFGVIGVVEPVANFSADIVAADLTNTITFTDLSTNTPTSWDWDFGDGSAHSTDQNPTHQYDIVGTFTVTLIATNAAGSDSETKIDYITVTFTDTFTDTNGTLLTTHNSEWTAQTANVFEILNNGIVGNGAGGSINIATMEANESDVNIEINLSYLSTNAHNVGIVGRFTDVNNLWYIKINTSGNGFQIIERNAGVETVRKFSNTLPTVGSDYLLQITFSSSTITATFRSVTITYASATFNQTATKFGVYSVNTNATNDAVNNRILDFFVGAA